jgi:hypothetical protein
MKLQPIAHGSAEIPIGAAGPEDLVLAIIVFVVLAAWTIAAHLPV